MCGVGGEGVIRRHSRQADRLALVQAQPWAAGAAGAGLPAQGRDVRGPGGRVGRRTTTAWRYLRNPPSVTSAASAGRYGSTGPPPELRLAIRAATDRPIQQHARPQRCPAWLREQGSSAPTASTRGIRRRRPYVDLRHPCQPLVTGPGAASLAYRAAAPDSFDFLDPVPAGVPHRAPVSADKCKGPKALSGLAWGSYGETTVTAGPRRSAARPGRNQIGGNK